MDKIDLLYKNCDILSDAKDKVTEHENEFQEIINAVKGSTNEKRLASQLIVRFFKHFPKLANQAMDAMLDLCEDEDVTIRKQAIKDLTTLCKDNKEHVPKIADVLAQILQSEDHSEITMVQNSIATLFQIDVLGTLAGLFSQVIEGDEVVRERTLKLLVLKLKNLDQKLLTKEVCEAIFTECKKVLQDVTANEFVLIMTILSLCKIGDSVSGQQQLVDLVAEQCGMDQPFTGKDKEQFDRFVMCVKHATPYFSSQVRSTPFVNYICSQLLPSLNNMDLDASMNGSEISGTDQKLELFKLLAELSPGCGAMENPKEAVERIYNTLLEYMPLPSAEENGETAESDPDAKFDFSHVESLMYAFHQLGRQSSEFLTENADRLKDFRLRLQYFARGVQGYMKKLRESLKGKTGDQLKDEESRIKVLALRTTSNINTLIRDLFRNPPSFKAQVTLSFKPTTGAGSQAVKAGAAAAPGAAEAGPKRHAPITFEDSTPRGKAQNKKQWEPYSVPSGKFSSNVSTQSSGYSRPRGRGGFRGGRGNRRGGY